MRSTTRRLLPAIFAAALTLGGCKASGDGGARDAATDAPEASAAAPTCGAGEAANAAPAFCYRLPAGMKGKGEPVRKKGRFQLIFEGDAGAKISFIVWNLDAFDATWKSLEANAAGSKATDAKSEDVDGGKTKLLRYTTPGQSGRAILSYVTHGKTHTLECEAETPKGQSADALLAACKALHDP